MSNHNVSDDTNGIHEGLEGLSHCYPYSVLRDNWFTQKQGIEVKNWKCTGDLGSGTMQVPYIGDPLSDSITAYKSF